MISSNFIFKTKDSVEVFVYSWIPDGKIKAIVQIAHGMAEHAGRYEEFAKYLTENGFAVFANDHRGHGKTAGTVDKLGYFGDKDGWFNVVVDMYQLTYFIKSNFQNIPIFLFGHSMGSLLARTYLHFYSKELKGVILSGTAGDPGILGNIGSIIADITSKIKGKKHPAKLLNKLSFGAFNKRFKPNKTDYDWLSRDENEVNKYITDPFCGGIFSNSFFIDLLEGTKYANNLEIAKKILTDLPFYIFSGEKDPVGNYTKGVLKVVQLYQRAGIKNIQFKFYPDARHECINEINREEVYLDIIKWLNSILK